MGIFSSSLVYNNNNDVKKVKEVKSFKHLILLLKLIRSGQWNLKVECTFKIFISLS